MKLSIDTIRFLGLDMVDEAHSGHPGIVLGAAPIMYQLFNHQLIQTPLHPNWFNRDRFIMSAGHGSALYYATLHLAGFDLTIEDLRGFRKFGSKTPGHPEYKHTQGVDVTTGPLGQGTAHAVGMAIAESHLSAKYNRPELNVVDHYTYVFTSDGDLQEGIALESLSIAGHLRLGKLILIYDSNKTQLDGPVNLSSSVNIQKLVESMGIEYFYVDDSNDTSALNEAIIKAKMSPIPTLIEVNSIIGYGSKHAGSYKAHGAALGIEETKNVRKNLGYPYGRFEVDSRVYEDFKTQMTKRSEDQYVNWQEKIERYSKKYPELWSELEAIINFETPKNLDTLFKSVHTPLKEATRVTMGRLIEELGNVYPSLIGGSADLSSSTRIKGNDGLFSALNREGRNLNFGVREHAMAAIVNGLTLHHMRGMSGGFFTFSDYMKPSIRLAALMGIPSIYIFTHDSIAIGEDGPTHQPIEQLSQFRILPNIQVFRPSDANETAHSLRLAIETKDLPSMIVLTRQDVMTSMESSYTDFKKGGYLVSEVKYPDGVIVASGSEVGMVLEAAKILEYEHNLKVNIVSMPSLDLFLKQDSSYKNDIIPNNLSNSLAVELGVPHLWYEIVNHVMGLNDFGSSGKGEDVLTSHGFTVSKIVERYLSIRKNTA